MRTLLRNLLLFQVLLCVEMKSQSGNVVTGTEGGSVEIYCTYPDEYQYVSKYFCRDPCGYSDVLVKTEKADKVFSKGRYSVLNTVSTRSFSVTIKNLRLGDSGVYYCGADSWLKDLLRKVVLTVRKVTPKPTASPLSTLPISKSTDLTSIQRVLHITAGTSTTYEPALSSTRSSVLLCPTTSPTTQSTHAFNQHVLPVYGGVLGLLLCCVLVALVVLFRRRSNTQSTSPAQENQTSDPPPDQLCDPEEQVYEQVYDETLAVYSSAGPALADTQNSLGIYSVIQCCPSTEEHCSPYSVLASH